MDELHTILASHRKRNLDVVENDLEPVQQERDSRAEFSEIPELFFDDILVHYKMNRIEIMVLMYIYRSVWCRPNLYVEHGISQILSHTEMSTALSVTIDEIYAALKKIENFGFVSTVRSGQYFVRRYFTKEFDLFWNQTYDDFDF